MERYLRARTRWFDQVVIDAIDDDFRQIVALGAGYDGRSIRYAHPAVRWFEVDLPATLSDKTERVERLGLDTTRLTLVPADLAADDLADALFDAGLDPAASSMFTCEGVAGYLANDDLTTMLERVRRCAGGRARLAIELPVEAESAEAIERRDRLRATVAGLGEPLLSAIPRGEVRSFVESTGWSVREARDLAGRELEDSNRGPALVLAET